MSRSGSGIGNRYLRSLLVPPSFCHCGDGFPRSEISPCPAILPCFFSASLIVSALMAFGAVPTLLDQTQAQAIFLSWLIGNFIAIITLAPLLLVWVLPGLDRYLRQGHWRERRAPYVVLARPCSACLIDSLLLSAALLGAALLGWVGMLWGFDLEQYFPFAPLFLLLPLAGVALRGGLRGAVLGTVVLEGGLVLLVALYGNPNAVLQYQMGMIAIALTGLLLGGAMEARNQALGRLRSYNEALQRELVTTEQHLQVLLRAAPVGILEFDASERCRYISAIGCTLCGCTLEQAMGRNVLEFVHPNDRDYFGFVWQINRHSEETHWLEFRLNDTDLWCAAHWINRCGAIDRRRVRFWCWPTPPSVGKRTSGCGCWRIATRSLGCLTAHCIGIGSNRSCSAPSARLGAWPYCGSIWTASRP